MNVWIWILIVVLIVLAVFMIVGNFFCNMALSRRYKKGIIYTTRNRIYETADVDWFNTHKEETSITSSRNLNEVGYLFTHEEETPYWMIVIHGYSSQALNMANYVKGFYNMGYNVLAPELMGMGKSEGEYVAMAGYDADDIILWLKWINERHPDAVIGLFGVSMGASTVMNTLSKDLPDNVELFIEDSGYVNLDDEFKFQLKSMYHINFPPIISFSSLICKMKYGYFFKDIAMEKTLPGNRLPGLVLHGAADDFVPPYNADWAYGLLKGPKEIKYFEGARHIRAEHQCREEYWSTITDFMHRYSSRYSVKK